MNQIRKTNEVIDRYTASHCRYIFFDLCQGSKEQLVVHVLTNILEYESQTIEYNSGVPCREVIIATIILKASGILVSRSPERIEYKKRQRN